MIVSTQRTQNNDPLFDTNLIASNGLRSDSSMMMCMRLPSIGGCVSGRSAWACKVENLNVICRVHHICHRKEWIKPPWKFICTFSHEHHFGPPPKAKAEENADGGQPGIHHHGRNHSDFMNCPGMYTRCLKSAVLKQIQVQIASRSSIKSRFLS